MNIVPMRLFLIFTGLLVSNYSSAAPDPPQPIPPAPGLPIDDGVFLLVAIAIIFASYKLLQYKKRATS
jgi:hypothetical protein